MGLLVGCVPLSGGWDVDDLLQAEPGLAAIPHQRIGDMTPYPGLVDGRVLLVSCRYESRADPLPVLLPDSAPQDRWTHRALEAVHTALPRVEFEISDSELSRPGQGRGIEIQSIRDPYATVPSGMGDTLAECDVAPSSGPEGGVRGLLVRSEVRLRASVRDRQGRVGSVSETDWIAALLHELGHALGFAGHAARGNSPLVLDEKRLRLIARRVLAGDTLALPNLQALYAIEPGRILGEAEVSAEGAAAIRAVERLVAERDLRLRRIGGPYASAGDMAARLSWHWEGGIRAELRFPNWRDEIRQGLPLSVVPDSRARLESAP